MSQQRPEDFQILVLTCVADSQHINLVHPLALTHAAEHHRGERQSWVRVSSVRGADVCRLVYDWGGVMILQAGKCECGVAGSRPWP